MCPAGESPAPSNPGITESNKNFLQLEVTKNIWNHSKAHEITWKYLKKNDKSSGDYLKMTLIDWKHVRLEIIWNHLKSFCIPQSIPVIWEQQWRQCYVCRWGQTSAPSFFLVDW